jgi:hypothetical protein
MKTKNIIITLIIAIIIISLAVTFLFISGMGVVNNECVRLGCDRYTKFVGSKNSDKYYECSCGWGKNINEENLLCFKSEEDAENLGYTRSYC